MKKLEKYKAEIEVHVLSVIADQASTLAKRIANELTRPDALPDMHVIRPGDHWNDEETKAATYEALDRVQKRVRRAIKRSGLTVHMCHFNIMPTPKKSLLEKIGPEAEKPPGQ